MPRMSWQTRGLMEQLTELRERESAANEARKAAKSPEEIKAAESGLDEIWHDFRRISNGSRIMADTPTEEIVPILAVHVQDYGAEKWCELVVAHGGPRLDPAWLQGYIADHLAGRPREIDPIVQEAMRIRDSRVIPLGGKVVLDVDTGEPVTLD